MVIRVHRAAEHPFTTGMLLVGVLAFSFKHPVLGAFLAFSLRDYFLPTTYAWDDEGLSISQLGLRQTFPWSRFRSFWPDRNGFLLSPFRGKHRLENFRGVFVPLRHPELKKVLEHRYD